MDNEKGVYTKLTVANVLDIADISTEQLKSVYAFTARLLDNLKQETENQAGTCGDNV